jgi:hypothetical protein
MGKIFDLRYLVIILAMLLPIVIVIMFGVDFPSLSTSWQTVLQPLFIITNAVTSFYFFSLNRWKIPSVFLMLLTAFSVDMSPMFHNILAGGFFLTCLYPLMWFKRFSYYVYIYLFSGVIWWLFGLFWFEVWGVYTLCIFHIHVLWYKKILMGRK